MAHSLIFFYCMWAAWISYIANVIALHRKKRKKCLALFDFMTFTRVSSWTMAACTALNKHVSGCFLLGRNVPVDKNTFLIVWLLGIFVQNIKNSTIQHPKNMLMLSTDSFPHGERPQCRSALAYANSDSLYWFHYLKAIKRTVSWLKRRWLWHEENCINETLIDTSVLSDAVPIQGCWS